MLKTNWENNKIELEKQDNDAEKLVEKLSVYGKLFFWTLIIALLALGGFASYYIFQYQKSKELNFEILAPTKALLAVPFEITVNLENKSQNFLKDSKILIQLPNGVESVDKNSNNRQIIEQELSDIGPGDLVNKSFKMVFIDGSQTTKKINFNFSYLPEKLNARFEKNKSVEIFADQPAIAMNLVVPQRVFNREIFEASVNYQNVSDYDFEKVRLRLIYPPNFIFKESSVKPDSANNVWDLNEMIPGGNGSIIIKGSLAGPDQSFSEIKSQLSVFFENKEYLISEKSSNLGIASSPLSLAISANNSSSYISTANDTLNYRVKYRNNTDVGLNDVILKVKLSGEMFDFASLRSSGFFDSINNTITWNAGNIPGLKVLAPGAEGTAEFSINTKPEYPIKRMFDKNFVLKIAAEINSPTVPYSVSSDKTVGLADLETKMMGKMEIISGFSYISGAYPLKANQPANFKIRWSVKNYSTDVKDVKISGFLQSGIKWLNITESNIDAVPVYNERTGEVIWDIGRILATKGITGSPVEATFQIEATPAVNQVGNQFIFLNETNISAVDEFTGVQMSGKSGLLKTDEGVSL